MHRRLDPEDRLAVAKAQEQAGRQHGRQLEAKIKEAVKNGQDDARKQQNEHPDS